MAIWFYGLLHELGHLHPNQLELFAESHVFSDAAMIDAVAVALEKFPYPSSIKQAAIELAKSGNSVLSIDHLRREGLADIFAGRVMFKTTVDIMSRTNQRFDVLRFIQHLLIISSAGGLIDRCRRVALLASTPASKEIELEMALHPVALSLRQLMLQHDLETTIATKKSDRDNCEILRRAHQCNGQRPRTCNGIRSLPRETRT